MNRVRIPWFRREMSAGRFALVMNLPTLICLGLVLAYPVGYAAYLSVHRVGLAQLRRGADGPGAGANCRLGSSPW